MRALFVALVALFSVSAQAGDCFSTSKGTPSTHHLKRFEASLAGELDPFVLGDGGLLVFADMFTNEKWVIYEPNEAAPYAQKLEKYNGKGLIVAIRKSCLEKVRSTKKISVMEDLKSNVLHIRGKAQYFEVQE